MAMVTRFRAATRDSRADAERMGSVRSEIHKALRSIEREKEGLGRRLEEARTRAATLMGTEDGIYGEREPADEKLLVEAEAQMMNAYGRLKALESQHAVLVSVARDVDETETEGTGLEHSASSQPPAGWLAALTDRADPTKLRHGAAVLGWAILIGIQLSLAASLPVVALSPEIVQSLAFLGGAAALGIAYPRQRLALFGAGLAWVIASTMVRSVIMVQDGPLLAPALEALGLAGVLALPPTLQWFVRYRRRNQ